MTFLLIFALGFGVDAFNQPDLPPEVEELVTKGLEDNSWLSLATEQEFRDYCEPIYSDTMMEPMVASLMYFVRENNDWHTVARVRSIKVVDRCETELKVQAEVDHIDIRVSGVNLPEEYVSGQANYLVTVVKEDDVYKIAAIEEITNLENAENLQ